MEVGVKETSKKKLVYMGWSCGKMGDEKLAK